MRRSPQAQVPVPSGRTCSDVRPSDRRASSTTPNYRTAAQASRRSLRLVSPRPLPESPRWNSDDHRLRTADLVEWAARSPASLRIGLGTQRERRQRTAAGHGEPNESTSSGDGAALKAAQDERAVAYVSRGVNEQPQADAAREQAKQPQPNRQ